MKKIIFFAIVAYLFTAAAAYPQFGKNIVQYKNFEWFYIQTKHFDVYFYRGGERLAEFTARAAEDALESIQKSYKYQITNRISIIIYNSNNDFQETNVIDQYLSEGIEGFTEMFKNRVVIRYEGSYAQFNHLIHHELVHAVNNDMFYGGSIQNVISKNISLQLPIWFHEGMAEYQSLKWDNNTDMFIRDAVISGNLPDIRRLDGYFAYRGGQSVFFYIAQKYGEEKISEIINRIRNTNNLELSIKSSLGIDIEELNLRWKKELRKIYWPDVAKRNDPDEYAKRLTDHKKDGGSYNTSPAISPQGDKVVFISNRDFYFNVYIMNSADGKIIKRLVKGNRSNQFEELNVVSPGLSWSPDGKKIALSAKSGGYDVVYIINESDGDVKTLPFKFDGISSVSWSPGGDLIAFAGNTSNQSDIYIYDMMTNELKNLTNDIFSDFEPTWTPDNSGLIFSSDRKNFLTRNFNDKDFYIYDHDFNQLDLYYLNIENGVISRLTDLPNSDERFPIILPSGNEALFVSDLNGINNIYRMKFESAEDGCIKESNPMPVTNSLSGIYYLSASKDGKKIVFSAMYESAYNIFLLSNPLDISLNIEKLEPTVFIENKYYRKEVDVDTVINVEKETEVVESNIFTGSIINYTSATKDSLKDFHGYIFAPSLDDSSKIGKNPNFESLNNFDSDGNFAVNRYKINFSPDLIYANAGYSTLYGLSGTTVLTFSDMLGNHRIVGITSLQIDLKNSDYGAAYYYLPKRIDWGVEGFHMARFVYIDKSGFLNLYRFRNYGVVLNASYPLDRFYRFDFGLSWLNISAENLDDISIPSEKNNYFVPSASFIHDNTLWGYTSPIEGTRYNFTLYGNPGFGDKKLNFYSLAGDYRTYFRFFTDYSFVIRLSAGKSGGNNPPRFFIGGTENWINRTFATNGIPFETASDFAFLTPVLPLRGYNYAEKIGTAYSIVNFELRFPLIRYLVTGGLPLFFQNILGVMFFDMGTAWNRINEVRMINRDDIRGVHTQDLLMGMGYGTRMYLLFFLVRFDVAWSWDLDSFSQPKYYFSLGWDF